MLKSGSILISWESSRLCGRRKGQLTANRDRLQHDLPVEQVRADLAGGIVPTRGRSIEMDLRRCVLAGLGGSFMLVRTQQVDRRRELDEESQEYVDKGEHAHPWKTGPHSSIIVGDHFSSKATNAARSKPGALRSLPHFRVSGSRRREPLQ